MKTGDKITMAEFLRQGGRQVLGGEKPAKYRAKPITVDGERYDSKKEARYLEQLKFLAGAGYISNLILKPRFKFDGLFYDSGRVIQYWADASYTDGSGVEHVVDVKGVKTPAYKIKKALMYRWFGIEVEEV